MGKTRLAAEAVELARSSGMAVLPGRATPSPTPAPYRPLAEAFGSAWRGSEPPVGPAQEGLRPALEILVPAWAAPRDDRRTAASTVTIGEAALALLEGLGGAGALLVVDDLHWSDPESLEVLDYLADKVPERPVLVVAHRPHRRGAGRGTAGPHPRRPPQRASWSRWAPSTNSGVRAAVAAALGTADPPPELVTAVARAFRRLAVPGRGAPRLAHRGGGARPHRGRVGGTGRAPDRRARVVRAGRRRPARRAARGGPRCRGDGRRPRRAFRLAARRRRGPRRRRRRAAAGRGEPARRGGGGARERGLPVPPRPDPHGRAGHARRARTGPARRPRAHRDGRARRDHRPRASRTRRAARRDRGRWRPGVRAAADQQPRRAAGRGGGVRPGVGDGRAPARRNTRAH